MNTSDISKLSYSDLVNLSKKLNEEINSKRNEEIKVLADGYIKKTEAAGFSALEAIEALKPYVKSITKPRKEPIKTAPVLYRDPANPSNTWSGRGRAAKWLAEYEAQGRSRNEFQV